jgi:hypothetical protein
MKDQKELCNLPFDEMACDAHLSWGGSALLERPNVNPCAVFRGLQHRVMRARQRCADWQRLLVEMWRAEVDL